MCQIKWIDADGNATPDDNAPVGRVRCKRFRYSAGRRTNQFDSYSEWFTICAEHAKSLVKPGMDDWDFEPYSCDEIENEEENSFCRAAEW